MRDGFTYDEDRIVRDSCTDHQNPREQRREGGGSVQRGLIPARLANVRFDSSRTQSDAIAVLIRADLFKRRHGSSLTRRNGKTHSARPPYLLSAHISLHSK